MVKFVTKEEAQTSQSGNTSDNFGQYGETHTNERHDGLQPVRHELSSANAGDQRVERTGNQTTNELKVDWRKDIQQAAAEIDVLNQIKGKTGVLTDGQQTVDAAQYRQALQKDLDVRFMRAFGAAMADPTAADTQMFKQIAQVENVQGRMQSLGQEPEVQRGIQALGFDKKEPTPEQIQNAILQTALQGGTDASGKPTPPSKLTEYLTLKEMETLGKQQVGESLVDRKAPMLIALSYAEYLMQHKDGVTQDPLSGQLLSARDVLLSARRANPDMAGNPQAEQMLQRAGDQQVQNQQRVVAQQDNPFATVQQAMQTGDLHGFQQAFQQAQDKKFDPTELQKQIDEIKKQPDSPENQQKIKSLQDLTHARAYTEGMLGVAMLQQPQPDLKGAIDHLTNAQSDPTVVAAIQDGRGNLILPNALRQAIFAQNPNFQQAAKDIGDDMKQVAAIGQTLKSDGDKPVTGPEIDKAIAAATDAYNKADSVVKALGPNGAKLEEEYDKLAKKKERTPEEEATMQSLKPYKDALHYKTQAALMLAGLDMAHGDPYAADKLLKEADADKKYQDDHPEAKKQIEEMKAGAESKIHDIEESKKPWYERAIDWTCDLPGKAWGWVKDHAKLVAGVVGLAAAVAITVGTGGLGAPAGVAIAAGILGGGVLGATAGGGLEVASGKANTFWQGFKDTAPAAFQGSAIGATLVGFAPAAAASTEIAATGEAATAVQATGWSARAASLAGKLPGGAEFMANGRIMTFANMAESSPVLANMARWGTVSAISGIPANIGKDNFASSYANYVATGTLFGLGGKGFLAADAAKNAVFEGFNPHGDNYGASQYLRNVGLDTLGDATAKIPVAGRTLQPYLFPFLAEQGRDGLNGLYNMGADFVNNKYMHQVSEHQIHQNNLSPEQVQQINQELERRAHQGDQPQQPQPQPQPQSDAQPVQPQPQSDAQPVQPVQRSGDQTTGYSQYVQPEAQVAPQPQQPAVNASDYSQYVKPQE